jgi:preprotein translocase subunit SecE
VAKADKKVAEKPVTRKQLKREAPVPRAEKRSAERKEVHRQPNRVQRYLRETVGELRKVSWPTRAEAQNLTIVVLIVIVAMSTFLGLLDFVFARFFAFVLGS